MDFNFKWKDEYSTGIEEIDIQHKELLSMIGRIYDIGQNILEKSYVDQLLEELAHIAHKHFTCEEELMMKYKYPKMDEQIRQHKLFTEIIHQQIAEARNEQFRLLQLLFHLGRWFVDHDNNYDKELGKFIISNS